MNTPWLDDVEKRHSESLEYMGQDDPVCLTNLVFDDFPALIATIRSLRNALGSIMLTHEPGCEAIIDGTNVTFRCVEECTDRIVRTTLARLEAGPLV